MKARHIYIIGMAALTLTGCVKEELFDTPHPGKGRITVTADWSARGEGIATPESWNLSMGDYHGTETAATHAAGQLFPRGMEPRYGHIRERNFRLRNLHSRRLPQRRTWLAVHLGAGGND